MALTIIFSNAYNQRLPVCMPTDQINSVLNENNLK